MATTPSAVVTAQSGDTFVVRLQWRRRGASEDETRFQVLRVRDDAIYEMREFRSGREALRAAK